MNTSAIYTALINVIYPVGTVIQNYDDSTNPGDRIPGTSWVRIENRFLVGQGSFGDRNFNGGSVRSLVTGGEATVALTPENLPIHSHNISFKHPNNGGFTPQGISADEFVQLVFEETAKTEYTKLQPSGTYTTSSTGDNNYRHNNMPPYTRVYGWYRYA